MIHFKACKHPYLQAREFYFLDWLHQQGAPVPRVLSNDTNEKRIGMEYAGTSLLAWLQQGQDGPRIATVLLKAVRAFERIAACGVLHLDMALRNVVIPEDSVATDLAVKVIDFDSAISADMPLRKNLWLYPTPQYQHPLLCDAIRADWLDFFNHHQLAPPPDWEKGFSIDADLYQKYWPPITHVDALSEDVRVLSHALGRLILECQHLTPHQNLDAMVVAAAHSCLDHNEGPEARASLNALVTRLTTAASVTPRPGISSQVATPSKFTLQQVSQSQAKAQPQKQSMLATATSQIQWKAVWAGHALAALGLGFADSLYSQRNLLLTHVVFLMLVGLSLLWILCGFLTWLASDKARWMLRALIFPALGLSSLGLESWAIHRVSTGPLVVITGVSLALFVFALWSLLARKSQSRNTEPISS